jgi:hypothetical protein
MGGAVKGTPWGFGAAALASCWGSVAVAQTIPGEPGTGTLIGYGVMAAIAITPTIGLLLKLGRDVGRYEARQENLSSKLGELTVQLQVSISERRSELAAYIAEVQKAREATTAESREMRGEFARSLERMSEQMMPREMSVLQLQGLTTKVEADVLRALLKELRLSQGD